MSKRDDERFRVRSGTPRSGQQKFVSQVLREVSKAGGKALRKTGGRPGARLGRGHVAARFTGRSAQPGSRRVTIKTRLVNLKQTGSRSTITHLRYIERDGVGRDGKRGQAYGPATDNADLAAFEERGREDRHQFRFIISPEDAEQLDDLHTYTRHLMSRMEADLGTTLDWVAVNHWNTDNPHTHVVLRGKDHTEQDLIISRDYIAQGMRDRASELATEWLGPRTEQEIQLSLRREVDQERWTGLDRALKREMQGGRIHLNHSIDDPFDRRQRVLLAGRLQCLRRMGLAHESSPGVWVVHVDVEQVLRALGERGDIVRTMQRAMGYVPHDMAVFEPGDHAHPVIGRIVAKGMADELYDRCYLVVDSIDGKAHYVTLNAKAALESYPLGAVVEVRGSAGFRSVDQTIATLAVNGLYRTDHHLTVAKAQASQGREPAEVVDAHVRRLEALRRAGIVKRLTDSVWRVPADLPQQGRKYDEGQMGGVAVEVRSHWPIERQTRVIGATWLDQQLIGGTAGISDNGFGDEVREALRQRSEFLVEQGLAERRGQRVILARNLLTTLRSREIDAAATVIARETGLTHRSVTDGERVTGTYRRNVQLASGRFAMLDDGMGFSLVPWKPVIDRRIGQTVTAVLRGNGVTWEFGRQRCLSSGR
jgi:type IV secretory pathway VirD2 relaxase